MNTTGMERIDVPMPAPVQSKHLYLHHAITRLSNVESRIYELNSRVRGEAAPPVCTDPSDSDPSLEGVLSGGGDAIEQSITRSIQLLADLENLLF